MRAENLMVVFVVIALFLFALTDPWFAGFFQ